MSDKHSPLPWVLEILPKHLGQFEKYIVYDADRKPICIEKHGASKPFSLNDIVLMIASCSTNKQLKQENEDLRAKLQQSEAGAAVMLDALDNIDILHDGADCEISMEVYQICSNAKKCNAGRELLERMQQLEQAEKLICETRKDGKCSTRDYGMNQYENSCYKCCVGCGHAMEMSCAFVCPTAAEKYCGDDEINKDWDALEV